MSISGTLNPGGSVEQTMRVVDKGSDYEVSK